MLGNIIEDVEAITTLAEVTAFRLAELITFISKNEKLVWSKPLKQAHFYIYVEAKQSFRNQTLSLLS